MNPTSFGRYNVIEPLGSGGMAYVYLAHDPDTDRLVVIKTPKDAQLDVSARVRFLHEVRTIASLEHAAIVPVYDFGEEDDLPYLVMRYMGGGTLTDRLD